MILNFEHHGHLYRGLASSSLWCRRFFGQAVSQRGGAEVKQSKFLGQNPSEEQSAELRGGEQDASPGSVLAPLTLCEVHRKRQSFPETFQCVPSLYFKTFPSSTCHALVFAGI